MKCLTKLLALIFLLFSLPSINAQIELGIYSRHVLNPRAEIRLRNSIFNRSPLALKGTAIELSRSREKKLYAAALVFNIMQSKIDHVSDVPELSLQLKYKLFKNLFTKPKSESYFSLGPRVYFMNGDIGVSNTNMFPSRAWEFALEVPFIFNFEFSITEKIKIRSQMNVLAVKFGVDFQEVDNPSIPENLRQNSGFDLGLLGFNELRVGIGYMFESKE